jgi:hypothetical protein
MPSAVTLVKVIFSHITGFLLSGFASLNHSQASRFDDSLPCISLQWYPPMSEFLSFLPDWPFIIYQSPLSGLLSCTNFSVAASLTF